MKLWPSANINTIEERTSVQVLDDIQGKQILFFLNQIHYLSFEQVLYIIKWWIQIIVSKV